MLSTFTLLYNQTVEFSSACKAENLHPLKQQLPIPSPLWPLATTILLSDSMILTTLGTLYKWNPYKYLSFVIGLFHLPYCP